MVAVLGPGTRSNRRPSTAFELALQSAYARLFRGRTSSLFLMELYGVVPPVFDPQDVNTLRGSGNL